MATSKIVGIVLIKNEDLHVERVIRNIAGFCDRIIIADNQSEDHTFEIVNNLAKEFTNIDVTQ
ncbi:MAG: hypothetical protein NT121_00150, partial [Chloroflexi bacterium]|nr:hypothetical protein [Chloroflexota bacterium]